MNKKWGYIRETRAMALEAKKNNPNEEYTAFEDYLEVLYPGKTWINNKSFGKRDGKTYRIRPDFRCEDLKMIIEFDGLQHYTNPENIRKDRANQPIYESFGYHVIRIPYFIQLTQQVVKEMFGLDIPFPLFDPSIPSMAVRWKNTPAYCCPAGIKRMAHEFRRYPQQYEVNLLSLEADADEELSGAMLLKLAMSRKS